MAYTFNLPPEVDDNLKRYVFVYRVQELLRLKHNDMQQKYKDGLITKQQLDIFLTKWEEKSNLVTAKLLQLRELAKNNNTWDPQDVDDLFTGG